MIALPRQLLAAILAITLAAPLSATAADFENHLIQKGGVTIVYDGDGNRVSKTATGITTTYLVDTLNPTGYAQVVNESFSGGTAGNSGFRSPVDSTGVPTPDREQNHAYIYGLELISQVRSYQASFNNLTQRIYYVAACPERSRRNGHGSVRALTDPTGAVTDTYDAACPERSRRNAFGNLIHSTGSTPNNYLFAVEQFDPDLNLYSNRARYLNTSTGRFWSADTFEGELNDPVTLHQYLYAGDDPEDNVDPSGEDFSIAEAVTSFAMSETLDNLSIPTVTFPKQNIQVTIDDGPLGTNASTRSVLAKYGIRTMFFVVGQEVVARPEAVKAILAAGHSLGNHSFSHENLTHLSAAQVRETLRKTDQAVRRIAGYDMTPNWRAPFGAKNGTVEDAAASLGYTKHWGWDIDSKDSGALKGNNPAILKHIRAVLSGKSDLGEPPCFKGVCQILFHDFSPNTLDFVLQNLKQDGVKFFDFPR